MSILAFAANSTLRALNWIAPFLLKRKFNAAALADLIDFDVLPRHEAVRIDLGSISTFSIALVLTNRSPFDVELDRAKVELSCAGLNLDCYILERTPIPSSGKREFFLRGTVPSEYADAICKNIDQHRTAISAVIEFNCSVHNFQKRTLSLGGIRTEFVNIQSRKSSCSSAQTKVA